MVGGNYSFNLQRLLSLFLGKKGLENLEKRVFISASLIGLIACIVGVSWDIWLGLPLVLNIVVGGFILVYGVFYYLSRFKDSYNSLFFIFSTLCLLSVLYIFNGGLKGSIPPIYIVALTLFISISKKRNHLIILIATIGSLISLIILEQTLYKDLIIQYTNLETMENDLAFGYIACLIIVFILLSFFKNNYDKENREISNQKAKLQELNASKNLFFNIIAHDMREPFNTILGYSDLIVDQADILEIEELKQYAKLTQKSSQKAYNLLHSLLEWGKILQEEIHVEYQKVDINLMIGECVDFFKEKCTAKRISMHNELSDSMFIRTDTNVLQTIVRNLISNAVKFTRKGGSVWIAACLNENGNVTIRVKDNGIGMSPELISHLFDLSNVKNRKGTIGESSLGLGLIITKELVLRLNGELMVDSEEDAGSTFTICFPAMNSDQSKEFSEN